MIKIARILSKSNLNLNSRIANAQLIVEAVFIQIYIENYMLRCSIKIAHVNSKTNLHIRNK